MMNFSYLGALFCISLHMQDVWLVRTEMWVISTRLDISNCLWSCPLHPWPLSSRTPSSAHALRKITVKYIHHTIAHRGTAEMFLWQPAACSTNELVAMVMGIGCVQSERLNNRGRKNFHTSLCYCMYTHTYKRTAQETGRFGLNPSTQPRTNHSNSSRSEEGISFQHSRCRAVPFSQFLEQRCFPKSSSKRPCPLAWSLCSSL